MATRSVAPADPFLALDLSPDRGDSRSGEVAYDGLKMTVYKKALLPLRIEAYAASGMLIKTLHFKGIKEFGGGIRRPDRVPRRWRWIDRSTRTANR